MAEAPPGVRDRLRKSYLSTSAVAELAPHHLELLRKGVFLDGASVCIIQSAGQDHAVGEGEVFAECDTAATPETPQEMDEESFLPAAAANAAIIENYVLQHTSIPSTRVENHDLTENGDPLVAIQQFVTKHRDSKQLVFYYTGHGDAYGKWCFPSCRIGPKDLERIIEDSDAKRLFGGSVVVIAQNCYSFKWFQTTKAGVVRSPFHVIASTSGSLHTCQIPERAGTDGLEGVPPAAGMSDLKSFGNASGSEFTKWLFGVPGAVYPTGSVPTSQLRIVECLADGTGSCKNGKNARRSTQDTGFPSVAFQSDTQVPYRTDFGSPLCKHL